jgi:hypothetical protein
MNNEQQELLNEVYKNYVKSFFKGKLKENYEGGGYDFDDYYYSIIDVQNLLGWPQDGPISQEEFINKCKTDPEFSEKWGLQIEERELDRLERIYLGIDSGLKLNGITSNFEREGLDQQNIPTKLITITYNDKTITSYE